MGTYVYVDEDLIEKVQSKAIKLVPTISYLPYKERPGLPSLKYQSFHSDMILTCNLLHGHLDIDEYLFLRDFGIQPETILLSCLTYGMYHERVQMEAFSQCVVSEWNSLTCDTVE